MATNNNDDKSKIDKIREDLEKKLASLERSKTIGNKENDVKGEVDSTEEQKVEITDSKEGVKEEAEKSSFLDQISNLEKESTIEENTIEKDTSAETVSDDQEDAIFEISDEIEDIQAEEKVSDKEKEDAKIVAPIPEIDNVKNSSKIEDATNNGDTIKQEAEAIEDEEEEKSSKTNYIIYGIVVLLLGTVGYFALDYFKGKNKLDSEKTNKKITDLENRRYQDSIKLLEAEKRLAEFESQRYIDSISLADRLKLKVNNTDIAKSDVPKKAKKIKAAKPTTTIYKNNKAVATSKSTVNFDKVVASTEVTNSSAVEKDLSNEIQNEKDKEIVQQVKKEKKIETLNTIEKAPIYPGCERKKTERAKKTCMISKINQFVNKNFNAYVAQDVGLDSGIQKIYVSFIIDRNGYVNVLRTRAKHEALKKEAVRVVNKLPRMKPALKNGKKTQIVYNLPIVFSIE